MKKDCTVIYNPVTSGFSSEVLDKVCSELNKNYHVNDVASEYKGHAELLAKKANEDSDLVVSYGGDGTFGELIKGIYDDEQKALISHIPIGTANDLQKNFGLSKNPVKSAALIRDGVEENLDIFTINDVPFSYVGAFGYLANVPCNTPTDLKKRFKYLAYILTALKEFKNKDPELYKMVLRHDGITENEEGIICSFSNSIGFGGMKLFDNPKLDDNKFEVTIVKDINKLKMIKVALDYLIGKFKMDRYPDLIKHFSTSDLEMIFKNVEPPDPIDLDGDPFNVSNHDGIYHLTRGKSVKMQLPKR